ncbi:hypothetical protein CYMTET_51938 [Cymbomonas tetramitiformis]|uniref:Uncharacterized protein n=1 Tax=Cymbomonas tetramitiformis TaxID=36881 RepID=A0AAE0BK37_9CHLO|nr:hypothetical protein CYMTET_51938 [Cymbomonas tetramitiformis]
MTGAGEVLYTRSKDRSAAAAAKRVHERKVRDGGLPPEHLASPPSESIRRPASGFSLVLPPSSPSFSPVAASDRPSSTPHSQTSPGRLGSGAVLSDRPATHAGVRPRPGFASHQGHSVGKFRDTPSRRRAADTSAALGRDPLSDWRASPVHPSPGDAAMRSGDKEIRPKGRGKPWDARARAGHETFEWAAPYETLDVEALLTRLAQGAQAGELPEHSLPAAGISPATPATLNTKHGGVPAAADPVPLLADGLYQVCGGVSRKLQLLSDLEWGAGGPGGGGPRQKFAPPRVVGPREQKGTAVPTEALLHKHALVQELAAGCKVVQQQLELVRTAPGLMPSFVAGIRSQDGPQAEMASVAQHSQTQHRLNDLVARLETSLPPASKDGDAPGSEPSSATLDSLERPLSPSMEGSLGVQAVASAPARRRTTAKDTLRAAAERSLQNCDLPPPSWEAQSEAAAPRPWQASGGSTLEGSVAEADAGGVADTLEKLAGGAEMSRLSLEHAWYAAGRRAEAAPKPLGGPVSAEPTGLGGAEEEGRPSTGLVRNERKTAAIVDQTENVGAGTHAPEPASSMGAPGPVPDGRPATRTHSPSISEHARRINGDADPTLSHPGDGSQTNPQPNLSAPPGANPQVNASPYPNFNLQASPSNSSAGAAAGKVGGDSDASRAGSPAVRQLPPYLPSSDYLMDVTAPRAGVIMAGNGRVKKQYGGAGSEYASKFELAEGRWHTVVFPALTPASRDDVLLLNSWLQGMFQQFHHDGVSDIRSALLVYSITLLEIVAR